MMWESLSKYDIDVGQAAVFNWAHRIGTSVVGDNEQVWYTLSLFLAHTLPVLGINGFHYLLTRAVGISALERFRWQSGRQPPADLVRRCVWYVAIWHLVAAVGAWFSYPFAVARNPQLLARDAVPGVLSILVQLFVAHFFTDLIFYASHRLLHVGPFYRHIHKQHHQFNVSIGLAAQYAHPVELLLGNVIPVLFASVVFRYHFFVQCLWIFVAMCGTTSQHSGFKFPLSGSDDFHDFHHYFIKCNFGSRPLWDRIFRTDLEYRAYKRNGDRLDVNAKQK